MVKALEVTLDFVFGAVALGALALGAVATAPKLLCTVVREEINIRRNKS